MEPSQKVALWSFTTSVVITWLLTHYFFTDLSWYWVGSLWFLIAAMAYPEILKIMADEAIINQSKPIPEKETKEKEEKEKVGKDEPHPLEQHRAAIAEKTKHESDADRKAKVKSRDKKAIFWTLVLLFVLGMIGAGSNPEGSPSTQEASNTNFPQQPLDSSLSAQVPPVLSQQTTTIQYSTIRYNEKALTDAQFKAFARQQKGKTMSGRGYVVDVREKMFGGYEIWIDMDSPDEIMSVQDISFDVDETTALALHKDQSIAFSGAVKYISKVMGKGMVTLENVSIER